jgi:hypothetical protein
LRRRDWQNSRAAAAAVAYWVAKERKKERKRQCLIRRIRIDILGGIDSLGKGIIDVFAKQCKTTFLLIP